ncbi:uncharacterized protein BJ171DRAFT_589708 [Polychytrium aggregatum]|uniref:uncharacterized protein n=1 Tax=Polychytrium aggregatum TaxID=110093 RepID=UPI0022FF2DDB|nr:uncharacterized protein BJ171DRAFT_589708 [Polychytrium aggregatum]KAI9192990.1 hypothetical protein BJ171DRAFT_589708 [Polychytrium aggregatum]
MDPATILAITNTICGTLLIVSETLPFMRNSPYNGIIETLASLMLGWRPPGPTTTATTTTGPSTGPVVYVAPIPPEPAPSPPTAAASPVGSPIPFATTVVTTTTSTFSH